MSGISLIFRIIAGKRADPIRKQRYFSRSERGLPNSEALAPWENASERDASGRSPHAPFPRHSFKMPITTTKLSENENEPGPNGDRLACGNRRLLKQASAAKHSKQ